MPVRSRWPADHLPGAVADRTHVAQLLASVDLMLAPGPAEGLGLAALEALASGTPVIGRRRGALPEVVDAACGAVTYGHPGAAVCS